MLIIQNSAKSKIVLMVSITLLKVVQDVINVQKVVINAVLVTLVNQEAVKPMDSAIKVKNVKRKKTPKVKYAPLLMNMSQ
mmetsp:Transcript_31127/g.48147  ORF Transcript_31127/g.48147 Transcript_31127/m.48147 type:complete len:80 (+) Transcript_31127:384-623(+)